MLESRIRGLATAAGLLMGTSLSAYTGSAVAEIKTSPGDYAPVPAGTDLALLYLDHVKADDVYAGGDKVLNGLDFTLDVELLRFIHYFDAFGMLWNSQLLVPFGQQDIGLTDSSSNGVGDILLGGTVWPWIDQDKGRAIGVTLLVTAPTGTDVGQGYALSQDRWGYALQAGYNHRFSGGLSSETQIQVEAYSNTGADNINTDPLYQLDEHLRYQVTPVTHVALSYRQVWGQSMDVAGTSLSDSLNTQSLQFTAGSFVTPRWQLQAHYLMPMHTRTGPEISVLELRILRVF